MDLLIVILRPELISLLICLCAVAGAFYAFALFVKEQEILQGKLHFLNAELSNRRQHVEGKKEEVKELQQALSPLKTQESEIRAYYGKLAVIQREAEAQKAEEEEEIKVGGKTSTEKKEKAIGTHQLEWS